jgi:hypothetical protein
MVLSGNFSMIYKNCYQSELNLSFKILVDDDLDLILNRSNHIFTPFHPQILANKRRMALIRHLNSFHWRVR